MERETGLERKREQRPSAAADPLGALYAPARSRSSEQQKNGATGRPKNHPEEKNPTAKRGGGVPWSGRRDSNPRQPAWQAGALPTELLPREAPYLLGPCPVSRVA